MANCDCKKPCEYVKDKGEMVVGNEVWLVESMWCKNCKRFHRYRRTFLRKKK